MSDNILIHNDNIAYIDRFTDNIKFTPTFSDIDKYISLDIIPQLINAEFDVIYIKDNLSSNYLELYGLRVAYHIRLSEELGDKRFAPIVILSDIKSHALNKLTSMAKILFTKSVFIGKSHIDTLNYYNGLQLNSLTVDNYEKKFLNLIEVKAPRDYLSHHDIANEWAIHQWSQALAISTPTTEKNYKKISSMLYFKYLKNLRVLNDDDQKHEIKSSNMKGKILYIDDEWDKGWSDILKGLFSKSKDVELSTFEYGYQDKHKFTLINDIKQELLDTNPDVVLLDLRLTKTDHDDGEDLDRFTGIRVVNIIKEINPGIQIIMLTATSKSVILEKLYEYGILGYIKKEHPNDLSIHTADSIDKLVNLVDRGLERKYLKDIWTTKNNLIQKLENDPFEQHFINFSHKDYSEGINTLRNEARFIFDILNGEMDNKLNYALISIASSLDALQNIFIESSYNRKQKKNEYFYLGSQLPDNINSLKKMILYIINKMNHKITFKEDEKVLTKLIKARNDYIHSNTKYAQVTHEEILKWFKLLNKIIEEIEKPETRKKYKQRPMNTLSGLEKFK